MRRWPVSLDSMTQSNKETTIFFPADKTVDYETLMGAMDSQGKVGYPSKVGVSGDGNRIIG